VDDGGRRLALLTLSRPDLLAQDVEDPFPGPAAAPGVEVTPDRAFRREVVGRGPPGRAVLVDREGGVDGLARVEGPGWAAPGGRWQEGLQSGPLSLGQVRGIQLAAGPGIHSGSPGIEGDRAAASRICRPAASLSSPSNFPPPFLVRPSGCPSLHRGIEAV